MKVVRISRAAALFLLFGATVPAYAQQDRRDEKQGNPERQQGRRQQGAPTNAKQRRSQEQPQQHGQRQERREQPVQQPQVQQPQQQQTRQQQGRWEQQPQDRRGEAAQWSQQQRTPQPQQQPDRTRQQAAAWQQQRGWARQGGWQGNSTWQQNRAQRWEGDHRNWTQRGGYGGYYIPRDRFVVYFGVEHRFRIRHVPAIYMGYPRFDYGGYSFLLVDPWPEYWADNWYATDDLYIDYDDGYYLYNHRYPYIRLAITVAL